MDSWQMMKGTPHCVLKVITNQQVLELVTYPDGSFGILRDGASLGIWEPDQEEDCIRTLGILGGLIKAEVSADANPPVLQVLRILPESREPIWN